MIVAQHLSKYYGSRRALDDVSFEITGGEVVGFLGLNGAGKTTVLKVLSGLLVPSAGDVKVDGLDIQDQPREVRRRVGFLPERPPLYGDMTVRQMLRYAGRLNGVSGQDIERRIGEVAELTQVHEVLDDLVEWLSQGYRQRLGIGLAIVHKPALVVLDEPITGLDPRQIVGMRGLIRSLAEHHTVLLSSHILGEISQTCDRLLVLHQGRIVARGREAELSSQAAVTRIEAMLRGGADAARAVAEGVEGVSAVVVASAAGDLITLRADVSSEQAREALLAGLVQAGLGVRRYAEAEAGLESIFLKLTGAQGGSGRAEVGSGHAALPSAAPTSTGTGGVA